MIPKVPDPGPQAGIREEKANPSRREACFWHVAEAWGIGSFVPRTDLMLLNNKEVAAIHFLPRTWTNLEKLRKQDPNLPTRILEKYRHSGDLHKWAVLDVVIANCDRHGGNLMIGPEENEYPVKLIDHGSTFAGDGFDPVNDKRTFTPYYLRAWRLSDWEKLSPEEKLRGMPLAASSTDAQLKNWVDSLDANTLEHLLLQYGINPAPTLKRLAKVKSLVDQPSFSQAINALWVIG